MKKQHYSSKTTIKLIYIIKLSATQKGHSSLLNKSCQYKLLYTISNNIEVFEKPVPRTKEIPHRAVKFEAGEENRIV